jgi:hypothetical protein
MRMRSTHTVWILGAFDHRWHRIVRLDTESIAKGWLACIRGSVMEVDAVLLVRDARHVLTDLIQTNICPTCARQGGLDAKFFA